MTKLVRSRRTIVPFLAVLAIVLVAAEIDGSTGSGPVLGHFAGYQLFGRVKSIAASWTVPNVLSTSQGGLAGTWIGAEAPGDRSSGPFIQVGTNEVRDTSDSTLGPRSFYYAFWSDTAHHFHPHQLFTVNAGDQVFATLRLGHRRWIISISDRTTPGHARFTTADETTAQFNSAQWFQEDPSRSESGTQAVPYAATSPVRFRALAVNGRAPSRAEMQSSWMALDGRDLAPGPVTADAFAITPQTLGAPAQRYLEIVAPGNRAIDAFDSAVERWSLSTSRAQVNQQCQVLISAFRREMQWLAKGPWPRTVRPFVTSLIVRERDLIMRIRSAPGLAPGDRALWRAAYFRASERGGQVGQRIRHALHAPDLNPDSG